MGPLHGFWTVKILGSLCTSVGIDNTSVNIGERDSLK